MKKILIAFLALLLVASFLPAGHAADPSIAGVWSLPVLKGKDKGKDKGNKEAKKPKKDTSPPKPASPDAVRPTITTVVPVRGKLKK